jgi:hypothetical protein
MHPPQYMVQRLLQKKTLNFLQIYPQLKKLQKSLLTLSQWIYGPCFLIKKYFKVLWN